MDANIVFHTDGAYGMCRAARLVKWMLKLFFLMDSTCRLILERIVLVIARGSIVDLKVIVTVSFPLQGACYIRSLTVILV